MNVKNSLLKIEKNLYFLTLNFFFGVFILTHLRPRLFHESCLQYVVYQ